MVIKDRVVTFGGSRVVEKECSPKRRAVRDHVLVPVDDLSEMRPHKLAREWFTLGALADMVLRTLRVRSKMLRDEFRPSDARAHKFSKLLHLLVTPLKEFSIAMRLVRFLRREPKRCEFLHHLLALRRIAPRIRTFIAEIFVVVPAMRDAMADGDRECFA